MNNFEVFTEWADAVLQADCNAYLLIDGAQEPEITRHLKRCRTGFLSLFDDTPEQSLTEISPMLISLRELGEDDRLQLVAWGVELASRIPCISWMASPLAKHEMAAHLRNFHTVGLSEGQSMMLRWFDTRVLPSWLACLNSDQAFLFTGGMTELGCIDREAQAITLYRGATVHPVPSNDRFGEPLIFLTDQQYAALLDASSIDGLVAHLRRVITDETNLLQPVELVRFVRKFQKIAMDAGVSGLDSQAIYVLLALYTSGKGAEHPACVALMQNPPANFEAFYSAVQSLPQEAWDAGPTLWNWPSTNVATNSLCVL